jgi:ketosteroid isomerase-like protein
MPRVKIQMLAAALLAGTSLPQAIAAEPLPSHSIAPPDLAEALDAYNRATIAKDTSSLSALVTDDYMLINSDSSVQDKASYLADFHMPDFTIEPYRIEDPFYRVEDKAALSSGVIDLAWMQDGRHQARRLRISHFWVKPDGRWRIAFTQLTRIPESTPQ